MPYSHGLTLIELMIMVVVATILLGIGIPALGHLVEHTRLTTTTNQLLTALHVTRSEAIRRGHAVTLCTSKDGFTCTSDTLWHEGWLLYENPTRTGHPSSPEAILQVENGWADQNVTATSNQPVSQYITYDGLGQSKRLSGALLMGTIKICGKSDKGRAIIISSAGRPRVATLHCD
ncbi:GspH/FimT family pseudopilin [Alkalilimnicola ehrlichii]|uniref:GspH/FimT family pseudopilin n=1 Tax=Alkalilimnicola ehrlichii TaxID=351052 RepID=UPI003BA18385